jgi:uncharacterized membrane protein YqaE (UPF0057 family)
MSDVVRILFAIFIPPLAVYDKGWDKLVITSALWFTTGFFGNLAAFYFIYSGEHYDQWKARAFPESSVRYIPPEQEKEKRKREDRYRGYGSTYRDPERDYIELADGDVLEVVDPDMDDRSRRLSR